jgi:hypothetical protein
VEKHSSDEWMGRMIVDILMGAMLPDSLDIELSAVTVGYQGNSPGVNSAWD